MGEVIRLFGSQEEKDQIQYIVDDSGVIGVKHAGCGMSICRDGEVAEISCEEKVVTTISRDELSPLLLSWILTDSPHLIGNLIESLQSTK